jgi:2-dehydropantoate 2-reductase
MSIKNVLLCGLGAVGLTFGVKMLGKCQLKILVDEKRLENYKQNPPSMNGNICNFDYILPTDNYTPDLIIISTKADGLESVLEMLPNFVNERTRIISLINGISSESIIKEHYPKAEVLKSYFIGHSAVRNGNSVTQDGVAEIVFEKDKEIEEFLTEVNIDHSSPDDIDYSMWLKYTLNLFSNQTSAILNMTFGELKHNKTFTDFAKKIIAEVKSVAQKEGVNALENLEKDAFAALEKMSDDGKTSMLQDILANRKTEVDIFAGEIIKLGKKHGVQTPYNQVLYDLIKIREELNEYRIHTC